MTAQTLEYALRRQCEVAPRHYLTELFWLGSELSQSAMLVPVTPATQALTEMSRQWPFFRALLSNIDMVLAKSDLALGSRYSDLVPDARLRRRIFGAIEAEWQRTHEALALITGEKQRLAGNVPLARSIHHRFPYIDPLHHLQVELVRRLRHARPTSARAAAFSWRSTVSLRA